MVDEGPSEGEAGVDPWGSLVHVLKLVFGSSATARTEATLFVASGLILARIEWLDRLGAAAVRDTFAPGPFVVFLYTGSALFVRWLIWSFGLARRRIDEVVWWRRARERVGQLSEDEKAVLRPYIERRSRTQDLDPFDPVVLELVEARLIKERAEGLFVRSRPFVLEERVWKYLDQDPALLEPNIRDGQDEPEV